MTVQILQGDVRDMLRTLPAESVQCVVTSPPYFRLRSYLPAGHPDKHLEIGSEQSPDEFVAGLVNVFREVRRVMRKDAVLFCNIGDSYAGSGKGSTGHNGIGDQEKRQGFTGGRGATSLFVERGDPPAVYNAQQRSGGAEGIKPKSLFLIPERLAIAMQDDGWIVRSQIAWCKRSAMPESVRDRPTSAWEPIWMFTKSARYFWDQEAVRQPARSTHDSGNGYARPERISVGGRGQSEPWRADANPLANIRNVWLLGPEPSREEHYAAFPTEIPRRCILAASRKGDVVLDPFLGTGTTALVADRLERHAIGVELNPAYAEIARRRITNDAPMFANVEVAS